MVRILAKRRVEISGLTAVLVGHQEAQFGSGQFTNKATASHQQLQGQILEAVSIEPGLHEHRFRFSIPEHFSPSYYGQRCSTRYFIKLHLAIPWWRDRRSSYEIAVGLGKPTAKYPGQAALFASREGGPDAKRSYLEGSVAGDVLVPGEILRGAFALLNTAYNRYTKVAVSLIGTEHLHHQGRREEREVRRLSIEIDTRSPAEGESFAMALRVPGNLAPSAAADLWSLRWNLEIMAHVRLGRGAKVRLPISVVPSRFQEEGVAKRPAPRVGSARLQALWQSVAEELGLEFVGSQMRATLDGVSVFVSRQHRGRRGWALVADLHYRSLCMGASVQEASLLRGTVFGGVKIGVGAWDKAHHASAHRDEQARVFFAKLGPALGRFLRVELDDAHAQVEVRDSGGRRGRLLVFAQSVLTLARALQDVRTKLPIPAEFAGSIDEWRSFATQLGSALEHGDMSIRGRYQGLSVETLHQWSSDGELWESSIRLFDLSRVGEDERFEVSAGGGRIITDSDLNEIGDQERAMLAPALRGARWFSCRRDELRLALPPALNPVVFEKHLPALATFARSRGESVGPYR